MLTAFDQPFYSGIAVSTDTSAEVVIGGHPYQVDWSKQFSGQFKVQSVPLTRPQADTSTRPAEGTLNPEGLWRRSFESWHHGAGQTWADRDPTVDPFRYRDATSDVFRFRDSRGVDCWTKHSLTLLNQTALSVGDSAAKFLAVASGRLFSASITGTIRSTADGTGWTTVGGTSGALTGFASDGVKVYAANGTSVISGTTSMATFSAEASTGVWYAKGRLFTSSGATIKNLDAAGAKVWEFTPVAYNWGWVDVCDGPSAAYLGGGAGDKSLIYRVSVKADGTGLDVPVVAGSLPDGELLLSLTNYAGIVVVGTSVGVRVAFPDSNSDLTLGPVIEVGAVRCAEGQGQFVWFGWDGHGLGRLNPVTFVDTQTPAYARDLEGLGGSVTAVATLGGRRFFTVAGIGVIRETSTRLATGWLAQGKVTYGLPDVKTAMVADVRHAPLPGGGQAIVSLTTDDGAPQIVGVSSLPATVSPPYVIDCRRARGVSHELTLTLAGGVNVNRSGLRVDPSSDRTEITVIPLILRDIFDGEGETERAMSTCDEYQFLVALRDSREVVSYQQGKHSYRVVVDDTEFYPDRVRSADRCIHQGTILVKLKGV